jgi:hypothetical protein
LQNTGVFLLRLILVDRDTQSAGKALSHAREAFASALRYYGCNGYYGCKGSQIGGMFEKDFKSWIVNTFNGRKKNGLEPILDSAGEVTLVGGSKLWPEKLLMIEPEQM